MGKGIGAALIASSVRAVLRGAARFISIEEAFNRTAYDLDQDLGDTNTFVTAFGACIDPVTGQGRYVDAGHGLAVIIDSEGVPRRLTSGGLPIGAISGDHWDAHDFVLDARRRARRGERRHPRLLRRPRPTASRRSPRSATAA